MNAIEDVRALHVLLKLWDNKADEDASIVDALRGLRWFNHVMLMVPSLYDHPDATTHPLVLRALDTCHDRGIKVIWGRWLWHAWPGDGPGLPNDQSHFDYEYYAAAIRRVKREAQAVGAVATFLDAEPYGKSTQKPMKRDGLDDEDRHLVQRAISEAVVVAGPVDYVAPTSSNTPKSYTWAMTGLGALRCDEKTYYHKAMSSKWPIANPPNGVSHRVHLFGSNVGLGRPEDVLNGQVLLTADDVKALDLTTIRYKYPECVGRWVWAHNSRMVEVIGAFSSG